MMWLIFAIQLCWQNPSENVDGSALNDLKEIQICVEEKNSCYGFLTSDPGAQVCRNIPLNDGSWHIYGIAIDEEGNRSAKSNTVVKTVDPLDPPTGGDVLRAPTGGEVIR